LQVDPIQNCARTKSLGDILEFYNRRIDHSTFDCSERFEKAIGWAIFEISRSARYRLNSHFLQF